MTTNTPRTLLDLPNLRVIQGPNQQLVIRDGFDGIVIDAAELPALLAALVVANDAYGDAL